MNEPKASEVKEAVEKLKINKPIMKITKRGKTLTLYLYGGEVVKHTLRQSSGQALRKPPSVQPPSVPPKGRKKI